MSNNVGIDFTEVGPPHGTTQQKPTSKDQGNETQDELITIGFRVKPKEKAIIQDYVNRMYNQFMVEPNTRQQKRMLENPSSGLIIKLATYSYMMLFTWFPRAGTLQKLSFNLGIGIPKYSLIRGEV